MKRIHFIISLLMGIAGFISCSSDGDDVTTLKVNRTSINIGANGGTANFSFNTNAKSWTITNTAPEWLNLSSTEGTDREATINLNVTTRSLETRSATLVISAGSKSVEIIVSQSQSQFLFVISTDVTNLSYSEQSGSKVVKVTTDASSWSISAGDATWLELSQSGGAAGTTSVTINATKNNGGAARNATITITAANAAPLEVPVTQAGPLFPNYNTSPLAPDATGMSNNAQQIAAKMKLGWNIGNTLEATGGETAWGNPKVTKALIEKVKQSGFNAIRIPCSWNQYMSDGSKAKLSTEWLNRVKEVVGYCVESDLYVVLNIHWDGGWLENHVTTEKQYENNAKQKAFWEQIATHLRDFDEHLMFASANEPNVENATEMSVLKSYHQTFIDAVRSTGGKNSYRVLVVQGPSTDITKTKNLMTSLPVDEIENRMMVEVHYYTPYNFCLMIKDESWGKMFYYWGQGHHSDTDPTRNPTYGEETMVDSDFATVKAQFVDKGIPVILGEFGAMRRTELGSAEAVTKHLAARAYYLKYVTKKARASGVIPFYWDAGFTGNHGSGLFDRSNNTVFDTQALNAIIEGAAD